MLNLLAARYTSIREGTYADRWVRAEHVKSHLSFASKRVIDFIAADKWPGHPYGSSLALHGHEVKVSRSDWLTELRDPEKSEAFRRYMHHWWLVVPDKSIVKPGELPTGWGLMTIAGGKLRAVTKAPRYEPEPLPLDLSISFAAAAARTAHKEPLHRDAPNAFIRSWDAKCGFCAEPAPCAVHQPRAAAAREAAR